MPSQLSARFTYQQRLSAGRFEVRYLQILPGSSRVIQCNLVTGLLGESHICLSHRWSGSPGTREILINGKPFAVSVNLWGFLEVARRIYDSNERFWIDAICIDQTSVAEKNRQVPLMWLIYTSAKLVITWLGDGDITTRLCAEAIRDFDFRRNTNYFRRAVSERNPFWDNFWEHITRFFENEYWKRAWIVQEVLLAKDGPLMIADIELSWQAVLKYWEFVTRADIAPQTHYKRLSEWSFRHHIQIRVGNERLPKMTLRELLVKYGDHVCSDFHDKIYAFLSLAEDRELIRVDYSTTREDLYFDTLSKLGPNKCFCFASCLLRILRLNTLPQKQYNGWYTKLDTDIDKRPCISFGINSEDILSLGTASNYTYHSSWMRNIPMSWRRLGGHIVRFLYTPVPAEFLVKLDESKNWYIAAMRFHHVSTWTKHIETFYSQAVEGIEVHTHLETNELCCLRFSRSALRKLLCFGEQHTVCEKSSYEGYKLAGPDGTLECGKPVDPKWFEAPEYRNPSVSSTPRPGTPNTSPTLSRFPSGVSLTENGFLSPQRTPANGTPPQNGNPWKIVKYR